ncbi:snaclec botrocetin subunit beta-like [Oratosquilla oratoria]|uniref:snaclec botrocetin subunit beta-like n=1 Tax=Oratosquilla oratoria TaxID=337810 RepID=UPI003F76CCC1
MSRVALWIAVLMPLVAVSTAIKGCPPEYSLIGGSCYFLTSKTYSWELGNNFCKNHGARLASVTTPYQYNGLLDLIAATEDGQYWLSGTDRSGKWRWCTGKEMIRGWWGRYIVTRNRCAYFCSLTRKYWPGHCNSHKKIVCERDVEPGFKEPTAE